jgi:hypothetical protein
MATEPKEFRNFYWHPLEYPTKPKGLWEKAETQEIDEPFRSGSGWAIRLPLTRKAMVIGTWKAAYSESEALTYAIRGRYVEDHELDWDAVRFGISGAKDDTTQKK